MRSSYIRDGRTEDDFLCTGPNGVQNAVKESFLVVNALRDLHLPRGPTRQLARAGGKTKGQVHTGGGCGLNVLVAGWLGAICGVVWGEFGDRLCLRHLACN